MALGQLTKQIAQQALLSATSKEAPAPAPATPPVENPAAVLLGQLSAMQKALKEDEELVVTCQNVRLVEIFTPSRTMAVLTGHDAERNLTRIVGGVESLQLLCRVAKVAPGAKPSRLNLVTPRQPGSNT